MRRPLTLSLPLLGAGLGLVGCSVGASNHTLVAGCDAVRVTSSGPRCELDFDDSPKEIRLLLRMQRDERVRLLFGGNLVPGSQVYLPTGETRVQVNVRKGARGLWLLVGRSGGLRHVPLSPARDVPWLSAARAAWYRKEPGAAIAALKAHLPAASPEDAALARGMLGRIHLGQGQSAEARDYLRASLDGLRAAGLVSDELTNAFHLATLLRDHDRAGAAARALLAERRSLPDAQPEMAAWLRYHEARDQEDQGNIREALRLIEQGQLIAWRFGDSMALANLEGPRRRLLRSLGLADVLPEEPTDLSPCWQAFRDGQRGYGKLLMREAFAPSAAVPLDADPRPELLRALATEEKECKHEGLRLSLVMHLARLDLLEGKLDQAAAKLDVLRAQQQEHPGTFQSLVLELRAFEGELTLARLERTPASDERQAWIDGARASFQELKDLAPQADEDESHWRALLGLARVAVIEKKAAEARQHFEAAEAYLDRRAASLPLGVGRGSFLGRHERGTAHYVAFLRDEKDLPKALLVMRRARVRGLLALAGLAAVDQLPAPLSRSFEDQRQRYEAADAALERESMALAFSPLAWRPWHAARRRIAQLDAAQALEDALKVLPQQQLVQGPPRPDEALLICHPLPSGQPLCLLQSQEGITPGVQPQEGPALSAAAAPVAGPLPALLRTIDSFQPRLVGLRRLRVLPYGVLREVDVHKRGWPQGLEVVYALDIPGAPEPAAGVAFGPARTAGLFFDPTNEISLDLKPELPKIERALQQHGFTIGKAVVGSSVDRSARSAGRATSQNPWLSMITERWPLLLFLAHTDNHGWTGRIGNGEQGELSISDLLLARSAGPLVSYVVTCFGVDGREDSGGVEALTLGTAQLVRRGARVVIAPSRAVSTEVGLAVLRALSERDPQAVLAAPGAELDQALAKARQALPTTAAVEHELAAFRVYVR